MLAVMMISSLTRSNALAGLFIFFASVDRMWIQTTLLNGTVSELWHAYYVPACVRGQAPGAGYMCQSIDVSYKYIGTPLFVANNAFDTNQVTRHPALTP